MADLRLALNRIALGDTNALVDLQGASQESLLEAAAELRLGVTHGAVAKVLTGLKSGLINDRQAREWASFVGNGYFVPSAPGQRIMPLDFDYELEYEDVIVEVLSKLENIGDVIDGEPPSDAEILQFLSLLGFPKLDTRQ